MRASPVASTGCSFKQLVDDRRNPRKPNQPTWRRRKSIWVGVATYEKEKKKVEKSEGGFEAFYEEDRGM